MTKLEKSADILNLNDGDGRAWFNVDGMSTMISRRSSERKKESVEDENIFGRATFAEKIEDNIYGISFVSLPCKKLLLKKKFEFCKMLRVTFVKVCGPCKVVQGVCNRLYAV